MDLFKLNNSNEATATDFYDTTIVVQNIRLRNKDKRMLHKLSRSRLKRLDNEEFRLLR